MAIHGQGNADHTALEPLLAEVWQGPHFPGSQLMCSAQQPECILLVEQWADMGHHPGPHGSTPPLEAFKGTAMPLLAGPPMVALWPSVEEMAKP
ncbi:MAG: hypothetical protein KIT10_09705 [Flavobacteriales bacterium]|nr:hypothetical protein [Flavobacteriales bacterium]